MPAKSKSQQRLFGMVHAYNKGEFHGDKSLRKRISELARRISDEDAEHFAKTPHDKLPEKTRDSTKEAQVITPDTARKMYEYIPDYDEILRNRSEKRRTLLGSAFRGTIVGGLTGGLSMGALGVYLANKVAKGNNHNISGDELRNRLLEAGARMGLWGAGYGAGIGGATGVGLYALDKIKGG